MKNFKVIIKTDRKNCPFFYRPYCAGTRPSCQKNKKLCTEKDCPFKEKS